MDKHIEPPLTGEWHHGAGFLCCGTIRVAKGDFDTMPSDEFKAEMFDWICYALNNPSTENGSREDCKYVPNALDDFFVTRMREIRRECPFCHEIAQNTGGECEACGQIVSQIEGK